MVSSTTRLAPIASIAWPRRMNSPSRSYSPVSSISLRSIVHVVDHQLLLRDQRRSRSKPSDPTFCASSSAVSSKAHEDAGLADLRGAADEELHAEQRLAAARAAADERRPAARQAAAGDFSSPWMPVGHFASRGRAAAATALGLRRMLCLLAALSPGLDREPEAATFVGAGTNVLTVPVRRLHYGSRDANGRLIGSGADPRPGCRRAVRRRTSQRTGRRPARRA